MLISIHSARVIQTVVQAAVTKANVCKVSTL